MTHQHRSAALPAQATCRRSDRRGWTLCSSSTPDTARGRRKRGSLKAHPDTTPGKTAESSTSARSTETRYTEQIRLTLRVETRGRDTERRPLRRKSFQTHAWDWCAARRAVAPRKASHLIASTVASACAGRALKNPNSAPCNHDPMRKQVDPNAKPLRQRFLRTKSAAIAPARACKAGGCTRAGTIGANKTCDHDRPPVKRQNSWNKSFARVLFQNSCASNWR